MERVRLVDWLKSERDQHVGGGLYYNPQILFAYNSNHMEGSTLSPDKPRSCSTRVPCSPTTSTMKSEQTMSPKQRTTSMHSIGS